MLGFSVERQRMVNSESEIIRVYLKGAERGAIFSRDLEGMAWRVMAPSHI